MRSVWSVVTTTGVNLTRDSFATALRFDVVELLPQPPRYISHCVEAFIPAFGSTIEDRYVVLGCVQGILYVVYAMRGEAVRLISARLANAIERRIYYGE